MNFCDQNSAPAISGNFANYAFRVATQLIVIEKQSLHKVA